MPITYDSSMMTFSQVCLRTIESLWLSLLVSNAYSTAITFNNDR